VRPRATITLILTLAAGLAAGCGSDDEQDGAPIPAESAAALDRQLDSIQARFEFGGDACADIAGNADPNTTAVQSVIDSLPQDVDPDLRDALQESFDRLFQLTEEQCDEEKGQETETQPEPAPETETETETETEPTETVPPEEDGEGEDGEQPPEETTPETTPETPQETLPDEGTGPGLGSGGAIVPGEGQ
jgi:outer membrane biosynthesis protein TonB